MSIWFVNENGQHYQPKSDFRYIEIVNRLKLVTNFILFDIT